MIKQIRVDLQRFIAGGRCSTYGCTFDGIPIILEALIPKVRERDYETLRFIFTILQYSRVIKGTKPYDLSSIINTSTMTEETLQEYRSVIMRILKVMKIETLRDVPGFRYPPIASMGPSGGSIWTSWHSLDAIKRTPLVGAIRKIAPL
jgi:hypothetical protein